MDKIQTKSVLEETDTFYHGVSLRGELTLRSVISYRAAIAIEWIKEDLRRGIQSETIGTFSELHDAVDANMYLIDENHPVSKAGDFDEWPELDVQGVCDQLNQVMDIINTWLTTRLLNIRNNRNSEQ
ncbi:MAG: hypothetical protein ACPGGD_08495 [Thalassolituus sp.]|jgi:hypothetical protein